MLSSNVNLDLAAESVCLAKIADILTAPRPPGSRRVNEGPAEIVDHVYLGSMVDALDLPLLRRLRITHVLNCAPGAVRQYANSIRLPSPAPPSDDVAPGEAELSGNCARCRQLERQSERNFNGNQTKNNDNASSWSGGLWSRKASSSPMLLDWTSSGSSRRNTNFLSCNVISSPCTCKQRPRSARQSNPTNGESTILSGDNPYDPSQSGVRSYLELDTDDVPGYPILALHYPVARRFLDAARSAGGRALVHCELGVNRSAALAVAYLVDTERLPLTQAVRRVRIDRPNVLRNEGFRRQLVRFAAERCLLDRAPTECP